MDFNRDEYFSFLEMLVNTDSGFDCVSGVNQIADFFEERLRSIHFSVTRYSGHGETGDCLVATNGERERYDVMLLGHIDTAFAKRAASMSPYRTDGICAYGPGIADMKAGTLAIYYILKATPRYILDRLAVCVVINGSEEVFSKLSENVLIDYSSRADHVFVMESAFPDGSHCVRRKGCLRYTIDFTGISVHSGYIFETRNASAILEMSNWIQEMSALANREKGTSANIGIVSGGTAVNIVAGKAKANFEFRMWEATEQKRIEDAVAYRLKHPFIDGVAVRVLDFHSKFPMEPNKSTTEYIERASVIAENMGYDFSVRPRGGLSDANQIFMYTPVCIDSMGPRGELNTSDDDFESMIMDSVPECIDFTVALMKDIAGRKSK